MLAFSIPLQSDVDPAEAERLLLRWLPELPIEEPVVLFALALGAFLVAPLLIERFGIPGIVGIVLAGTAIGPNGVGLLALSETVEILGTVGLVYLLFTVGLEMDLKGFARAPEDAALFGLLSFGIPFVAGTTAVWWVLGMDPLAAALLAAVFASHTLLAYPIVNRLDIAKNEAVTAVFGGILFTDTLALVVLAIVIGAVEGGLTVALFGSVALALAVLFGGVWLVVPRVARWFFKNFSQESYYEFLFVAVVVFAAASLAEILGLAAILGAFVAGIALNRLVPTGGTLRNRVEFFGNAFFIPFFLFHVGMLVDPWVLLEGLGTIQVTVLIVAVMVSFKYVAAWAVSFVQGYDRNQRGVVFGLSVGQAAAALAITLIGFEAGLFTTDVLNAVVLMLLVTAVASPWLTERYGRRLVQETEVEPGDVDFRDPRILLPLSTHAERRRELLELGLVLKESPAENPIHLLTVVRPGADRETEREVEEVERDLLELAEFGEGADLPVEAETRVNHNVASGIVRASVETRADLIAIGWDARRSFQDRVFGSIIDQVLDRTSVPVAVSRLGHPINVTRHVYVVVPSGIDHHEGFYEAVYHVKALIDRLGADATALVVDGPAHQYERLFDLVEPELEADFESVPDYTSLLEQLADCTEEDDLVVALSPREGRVGWNPALAALPNRLHDLPPHSFIVIHPREAEPGFAGQFLRMK